MYDSLRMNTDVNDPKLVLNKLTNVNEKYNQETGEIIYYGNLNNLNVKVSGKNVSVFGSIAKYFYGDNLHSLTRKTTIQAIEKLSDELNLKMDQSKVTRIDLASNILLKNEVSSYLACFGDHRYCKKNIMDNGNTLLYRNTKKTLEFYNKAKEMRAKRQSIPEIFQNSKIMRYELQFKKRLKLQLRKDEILTCNLYDENFYKSIIDYWIKDYFLITKNRNLKFKDKVITMLDSKQLKNYLLYKGINNFGADRLIEMLEQDKTKFKNERQFYRLKNLIKELSKSEELTEPSEAIQELDSKIKQVARYYR